MKLRYSVRRDDYDVHDIVEHGFQTYRRVSSGSGVIWLQQISAGEFHTISNGQHTISLEARFQLDVPAATPEQIRL